ERQVAGGAFNSDAAHVEVAVDRHAVEEVRTAVGWEKGTAGADIDRSTGDLNPVLSDAAARQHVHMARAGISEVGIENDIPAVARFDEVEVTRAVGGGTAGRDGERSARNVGGDCAGVTQLIGAPDIDGSADSAILSAHEDVGSDCERR